jgi:hypothetical protein
LAPIVVRSYHACQRDLTTERTQVRRHITRSTRNAAFVVDADDWDWRFRRDPFDRAPEISVQHQITDDQHAVTVKSPLNRF